ncbi:DNA processing protein [Ereboglobus sp. PH5-10]|uniref:DNA-processing protein DprA n=1 Tax=Ereboglobus sp. PH5-10 TaxID=2940629 RepID=UPI0024063CF7|nr:DNA-processing protein DprA [Ereboglobus sp. PH5-10]MDF9828196.1 DNA processing protein [Ereboglobus sp. PH5-10]
MSLTEQQAFLVLNGLPGVGPVSCTRLLAEFGGDPRAILSAGAQQLERVKGVGPAMSAGIVNWRENFNLAREEDRMAKSGAVFVTKSDARYPRLLREIYDPPIGLYQKGEYIIDRPCVAIVGTRHTTLYGQATAKKMASELARLGFCIVSGLARGIDTAAHEGALLVGGKTAAVLGTGIDIIYPPENLDIYRRIEAEGAVFSEFPFGRRADRQSFAMRNRIVAGMCEGVIVVESDKAGGSMITAKFAGEQGRQVFAVPGRIDQPSSAGCHQLIRDGATLVTCVDDVLSELNYLEGLRPRTIPPKAGDAAGAASAGVGVAELAKLSADEAAVMACFAGGAMPTIDAIASQTKKPVSALSATLMMLELKRLIVKRADGSFEARG